jgi:hypothetical protein
MFRIEGTHRNGDGAVYSAQTVDEAAKQIARMLAFGRRTYGDKYVKVVILSGTKAKLFPKAK